ncbi:MAG: hypothetical protein ACLR1G_11010 [Alistipes indistinctus]
MYKNASGKMGQLAGRTLVLSLLVLLSGCGNSPVGYTPSPHDLVFDSLAGKWDEAVPLGNGQVGALVWQKGDRLRFSLDRVDLWDLRPTEGMTWDKPVYDWICEQWQNNTYGTVQELLDEPYGRLPAPSKIPAGALEFHTADWGRPTPCGSMSKMPSARYGGLRAGRWRPSCRPTARAAGSASRVSTACARRSSRPPMRRPEHRPRTTPTRDRSSIRSAIRRVSFT